ncbi:Hypothetical predicted protein [Lecanosticta acicola]|uniref:Uncharacterized protein n=1 Tax=Lecanosticta acicola TaxID=111012 RepID=A0AAI8Z4V9_9PEZI|nr:Hypothetical predicted protein [Lecanosticta acicola]
MRVGKRPRRWRSGWRKAKHVLKEKTVFQVLIHRKRGPRVLSIGSSRVEIRSTPPQVASSETLSSSQNRHSATPSITRTLPSQNGRFTYTIHYGRNGSGSSLSVSGHRNALRFSHPVVNAVIPTPSLPQVLTPITPTPYSDSYEPAWSSYQPSQTTSRESTSTSITPTSAQFNGQVKPEAVAGDHVRNSALGLTVPQALNQLDGVPSSLRDRVELPRSVNELVFKSRGPTCGGRLGHRRTTARSLYLAKPLPFDARALTVDLEQCNGESNPADLERQNALSALEGESTVLESPSPSERRQRRELAPSSLYLARPHPFDANRLTQDLERCNGQGVSSEESRQNALQALEGSMPAQNSPDLGPLLQKYVADAQKQGKRATQYPGKEAYGQKRYTAFNPSMLPEPLRTSQDNRPITRVVSPPADDSAIAGIDKGKRPTDRQVEQDLEKARRRQFRNASARDFSGLQVEQLGSHFAVEQEPARPVRKSRRLDSSLPPAAPASPPSPHRKSVVLDNGYPPLQGAPLQHIKRKPLNATKPPLAPPLPHLPSAPQPGESTKAQIAAYTEMARLHQEQSRLMRQYAEDLSRQFPSPPQQGGGIEWKRTVKRAIMKDW